MSDITLNTATSIDVVKVKNPTIVNTIDNHDPKEWAFYFSCLTTVRAEGLEPIHHGIYCQLKSTGFSEAAQANANQFKVEMQELGRMFDDAQQNAIELMADSAIPLLLQDENPDVAVGTWLGNTLGNVFSGIAPKDTIGCAFFTLLPEAGTPLGWITAGLQQQDCITYEECEESPAALQLLSDSFKAYKNGESND